MFSRICSLLAAVAMTAASPAAAQWFSTGDSAFTALEDSLGADSNTTHLQSLRHAAEPDGTPAGRVRLGLILTRLGQVTNDRTPLDEALRQFAKAGESRKGWAAPWIGLGEAKLALQDGGFPPKEGPYQRLGSDYLLGAGGDFMRALEAEPGDPRAAELLAATVMRQTIELETDDAVKSLRRASQAAPTSPRVLLARGMMERFAEHFDSAVAVLRRYMRATGSAAAGVGDYELARAMLSARDTSAWAEADSLYYAGAHHAADPAVRLRYRDDVRWLTSPGELGRFDSLPADSLGDWVHRFWNARDARAGRKLGERLAEHYRRLEYATRHFMAAAEPRQTKRNLDSGNDPFARLREMTALIQLRGNGEAEFSRDRRPLGGNGRSLFALDPDKSLYASAQSQTLLTPYASDQNYLDDRGIIYLRYGEPDQRATYHGPSTAPNESWKYLTPSGQLIFHFVGPTAPTRLQSHLVYFAPLYASRGPLDPRYDQLAYQLQNGGRQVQADLLEEERQRNLEAVRIGTTTDAYPLRFRNRLDATVESYGLRDLAGVGTGALMTFAVSAKYLEPMGHPPVKGTVYPLHFRLVAERLPDQDIIERDTVRNFVTPAPLSPGQYLTGQIAVPLSPGRYLVTVVLTDAAGRDGVSLRADTIAVPAADDKALAVSDLVLGFDGATQQAAVGSEQIPLDPLGAVPVAAPVTVYYQVEGATPGATYRTELEVHRRYNQGAADRVRLGFSDRAAASSARYRRTLDLSALRPGAYELVLTLTGPDSNKVVRRRMLDLSR